VLVPCITDQIDSALLAAAGDRLKLIANYGAGSRPYRRRHRAAARHPRVEHARRRDRGHGRHDDRADPRRDPAHPEGLAVMQAGSWGGWAPTAFMGGRVGGKRLGILGMGRIGQAVARRARAFGMQVHYHNRRRLRPEVEADLEATWWESLDQMVSRMDVISINCPHTPSTFHLMNARRLKLMKPSASS
jgi:glyoxylate reductase